MSNTTPQSVYTDYRKYAKSRIEFNNINTFNNVVKLIIHTADLHIRNKTRHDEYCEQFEHFVNDVKKRTEGYGYDEVRIVVSGDIVHQKNTITNELITLVPKFIRALETIAPVIVIAGNHDLLLTNMDKQDTISAIFEAAEFKHTTFVDNALDYQSGLLEDDNIIWALYSIYDDYRRPEGIRKTRGKHILGLFHGTVTGSVYANGTSADMGVDIEMFDGCEYVLAGDIHKRQVVGKGGTELVYPGSLIQQDFGETVSQHGYCVWYLDGKNVNHEFVDLPTEYGMYKFVINSENDTDEGNEILLNN